MRQNDCSSWLVRIGWHGNPAVSFCCKIFLALKKDARPPFSNNMSLSRMFLMISLSLYLTRTDCWCSNGPVFDHCLSIRTKSRTLDLEFRDKGERDYWASGFVTLFDHYTNFRK